ncbi:hypothetical protein ElyMa_004179700 [Elysia marginata]|uniref:Uncharacterized protein n=1 Tax=Elysia marginata TaxID=1093978 RepID=A0AAV4GKU4_9GAST|nr:hypothetical protein ElyMa_004179700 [Elysia marginata]
MAVREPISTRQAKIDKIARKVGRVVGEQQNSDPLCQHYTTNKAKQIPKHDTHPLRGEFDSRLLQKSGSSSGFCRQPQQNCLSPLDILDTWHDRRPG